MSDNNINTVYEDRNGQIWVGTSLGGLNRFNPQTETFVAYRANPGNPIELSHNCVNVIYEDRSGRL